MNLPPAYRPNELKGTPLPFIALESVSAVGKSTLTRILTRDLNASSLHTLPTPHNAWSTPINDRLRPLPQLSFYLSGLLHASDEVRTARQLKTVIADRYQSSVIACHAAVHEIPIEHVLKLAEPFLPYVVQPTFTFYLRCSLETLKARLRSKGDIKRDDTDLLTVPGRLKQLLFNFETVAASDPSAVWVDTDGKTPNQLAHEIKHTLERVRA
ncbi:thymidylate kinase [Streptomyces sp. NBC_01445]|uniref:thymidylate kinase n=1 Tax=Streptomyces sp. NBC_01445 TaxID=2903869 RepID=UPI002DDC7D05|nr:thymidylate kinase [Streptomyces sp. NBC_01445]WSE10193.1 thymidylate kinase [Streptomyces sp. NBC_01445]